MELGEQLGKALLCRNGARIEIANVDARSHALSVAGSIDLLREVDRARALGELLRLATATSEAQGEA
jgi:hypothetical protein